MQAEVQHLVAALPAKAFTAATRLGLSLANDLDGSDWHELVGRVAQLALTAHGSRQTLTAWLGDILAHERAPRRGQISQCASVAGLDAGTLRNAKLVCRRIPVSRRHDALTWSHHCEIALALSAPDDIERWLRLAEEESLSTAAVRLRIRRHLAESLPADNTGGRTVPFRLMRDLRTAARTVDHLDATWRHWSSATAELALAEIQGLTTFIDIIRKRADRHSIPSNIRALVPRDLSAN